MEQRLHKLLKSLLLIAVLFLVCIIFLTINLNNPIGYLRSYYFIPIALALVFIFMEYQMLNKVKVIQNKPLKTIVRDEIPRVYTQQNQK